MMGQVYGVWYLTAHNAFVTLLTTLFIYSPFKQMAKITEYPP